PRRRRRWRDRGGRAQGGGRRRSEPWRPSYLLDLQAVKAPGGARWALALPWITRLILECVSLDMSRETCMRGRSRGARGLGAFSRADAERERGRGVRPKGG